MRIRGMQPSKGSYRQGVSLIGKSDQCYWEQILSSTTITNEEDLEKYDIFDSWAGMGLFFFFIGFSLF